MESIHRQYILSHYPSSREKLDVLNIADVYFRDDPELKRELIKKVPPILLKTH